MAETTLKPNTDTRLGGYLQLGSTSAPSNTTAGDLTAIRGFFTGNLQVKTGSSVVLSNAANNSDIFLFNNGASGANQAYLSDFTGTMPILLDGSVNIPSYLRVGSTSAPANTTAGDLTAVRLFATGGTITGITDLAVADGGTGASTALAARANLLAQDKVFYTVGANANDDYVTDGVADEVQINQAISAASSAGGGIVHLKQATYTVAASITMATNVILEGEGWSSIIKTGNSTSIHTVSISTNNNVVVRDLAIDGNKANNASQTGHLIRVDTADNVLLENLFVHDSGLHAIISNAAVTNLRVINCYTKDNGTSANGSGVYLNGTTRALVAGLVSTGNQLDGLQWKTSDKIVVNNLVSYSNGRYGIYAIDGHADISNLNLYSNSQIGLSIEDGASANTTVNVANGEIFSNQQDGIRVTNSDRCAFANLRVYDNNQAAGTNAGIRLNAATAKTVNYTQIVNCAFFDDQGSPTQTYGVWGTGAGTVDFGHLDNIVLTGNVTTQFRKDTWGANNVEANVDTGTGLILASDATKSVIINRIASGAGRDLTIQAGGSQSGGTNLGGGNLILSSGISVGNVRSGIKFQTVTQGGSGSSDANPAVVAALFSNSSTNPVFALGGGSNGASFSATGAPVGSNAFLVYGNVAGAFAMYRHLTANTAGNSLTVQSGGATSGATDKAAGDLILAAGLSTGTGASKVKIQTNTTAASTGTSDNTAVDRVIVTSPKTLTNNSAINLVSFTLASNTVIGGLLRYAVEVFDGTNLQMETGEITYQCANKGGVFSGNTVTQIGSAKQFLGSGTLTMTWAITGANPAVLSLNANSSLTPSTGYPRITYTVENFTQQAVAIQ